MAENTWLLTDATPTPLAQQFDTAAAAGSWTLNDSTATVLAETFAAPATAWTGTYWGPTLLAFNDAEVGAPPNTLTSTLQLPLAHSTEFDNLIALDSSETLPLQVSGDISVGKFDSVVALPFAVTGAISVSVVLDSAKALPFHVSGEFISNYIDSTVSLPFSAAGTIATAVQVESNIALPFNLAYSILATEGGFAGLTTEDGYILGTEWLLATPLAEFDVLVTLDSVARLPFGVVGVVEGAPTEPLVQAGRVWPNVRTPFPRKAYPKAARSRWVVLSPDTELGGVERALDPATSDWVVIGPATETAPDPDEEMLILLLSEKG